MPKSPSIFSGMLKSSPAQPPPPRFGSVIKSAPSNKSRLKKVLHFVRNDCFYPYLYTPLSVPIRNYLFLLASSVECLAMPARAILLSSSSGRTPRMRQAHERGSELFRFSGLRVIHPPGFYRAHLFAKRIINAIKLLSPFRAVPLHMLLIYVS